jgi:hypothetical protein
MLTLGDQARSNEIMASQKQAKFITIEVRRLSHCIGAGQGLARRGMRQAPPAKGDDGA